MRKYVILLERLDLICNHNIFRQGGSDYLQSMSLPLYHQDLCQLFERSDCPTIFGKKQKPEVTLETLEPGPDNLSESLEAMRAVVNALVHLRLNLVMPCQLKFSYIIKSNGKWGLRHAICNRDDQVEQDGEDSYNPEEFKYHQDSDSELIWNLGKIWLRFFTKKPIKIREMNQNDINQIIDSEIKNGPINEFLKRVLSRDRKKRMDFEQFFASQFFIDEKNEDSQYFPSLVMHLKSVSSMMSSKTKSISSIKNPFEMEMRYRHFMEYLDIDIFLENVKSEIKKEYYNEDDTQRATCQFTIYLITLQDYVNMYGLNKERIEMGERFDDIEDRKYYARFTKRMIMLKDILERKAKVLKNNSFLKRNLVKYLQNPDLIDHSLVYSQFKRCVSEYVQFLMEDIKQNSKDLIAMKLLTKLYITRTCTYIFNEFRTEVFQPFFKNEKVFNIKKLLSKINECSEIDVFQALLVNIREYYFRF